MSTHPSTEQRIDHMMAQSRDVAILRAIAELPTLTPPAGAHLAFRNGYKECLNEVSAMLIGMLSPEIAEQVLK